MENGKVEFKRQTEIYILIICLCLRSCFSESGATVVMWTRKVSVDRWRCEVKWAGAHDLEWGAFIVVSELQPAAHELPVFTVDNSPGGIGYLISYLQLINIWASELLAKLICSINGSWPGGCPEQQEGPQSSVWFKGLFKRDIIWAN